MQLPAGLRPATPQRAFVLVCALAVTVLLAWATVARVDVIVRTTGRVVPAGKPQIVQHLEGGIVKAILVQEGQAVRAGDALMELSDIKARSDLGQEQTHRDALRGRESRLLAEARGSEAIAFPADLTDRVVKADESDAFRARRSRVQEEARVLADQRAQKRGELAEVETRQKNLASELLIARQQHRIMEGLARSGGASQIELLDAASRLQRLDSQVKETDATLPRLRAAIAEADSKIGETWARYRADASADLASVRADLGKSTLELTTGTDRLDRNVVRAPVTGFVNRLMIATVGGVVRPGEPVLEITPDDLRIVVEARAKPDDRAHLRSGLPARVRLGAYDYATYGALAGRVVEVSADTLPDEHDGVRYYRVRIDAGLARDARLGTAEAPVSAGMSATADVVVGRRSILSYLLSPLLRFGERVFRDPR